MLRDGYGELRRGCLLLGQGGGQGDDGCGGGKAPASCGDGEVYQYECRGAARYGVEGVVAEFFLSAAVYGYFAGQFRCNSIAECVFQPVCLTALGGLWVYALPGAAMGAVDEFLAVFAG